MTPQLSLAPFRIDATPPMGHALCGGWIEPVRAIDDPLEANGFVLLGADKPIVICALDWLGLFNDAHRQWCIALAEAASTTPDRVALHCVHQHNAPAPCLEAQKIVLAQGDLPNIIDPDFYRQCLDKSRAAVQQAVENTRPLTHIASSQAEIQKVASNRRVYRDSAGVVLAQRRSFCEDAQLRAMPEGTIDPYLKTVAFYDHHTKIAACHYYATHPQSYYGDGRVNSEFVGLARKQRQKDEPDCIHLYFTGCAGDVSAGKYNDGSKEQRPVLTQRIYDGMLHSEGNFQPAAIDSISWRATGFLPPPRSMLSVEALEKQICNRSNALIDRYRPSFMLSWLRRLESERPVPLSSLRINDISLLHLPAECFVKYQLGAQQRHPTRFIATAGYGDCGPWYIPLKEEYSCGGYELEVAFSDPEIEDLLTAAIDEVLGS